MDPIPKKDREQRNFYDLSIDNVQDFFLVQTRNHNSNTALPHGTLQSYDWVHSPKWSYITGTCGHHFVIHIIRGQCLTHQAIW